MFEKIIAKMMETHKDGMLSKYSKMIFVPTVKAFAWSIVLLVLGTGLLVLEFKQLAMFLFLVGGGLFLLSLVVFFMSLRDVESSPSRAWISTWFGKKTDTVITHWPVLLLDWIPGFKVIGHVEIKLEYINFDFKLQKDIYCEDGFYITAADSKIAATWIADDSSAKKLSAFDDAGQHDGIKNILGEMFTGCVMDLAKEHSSLWMETHREEIALYIREKIESMIKNAENGLPQEEDTNTFDDVRDLGIKFKKIEPILTVPEPVRKERTDRISELYETDTRNEQVDKRLKKYRENNEAATWGDCRAEIIEELLQTQGKYQKIENKGKGGLTITNLPTT